MGTRGGITPEYRKYVEGWHKEEYAIANEVIGFLKAKNLSLKAQGTTLSKAYHIIRKLRKEKGE